MNKNSSRGMKDKDTSTEEFNNALGVARLIYEGNLSVNIPRRNGQLGGVKATECGGLGFGFGLLMGAALGG